MTTTTHREALIKRLMAEYKIEIFQGAKDGGIVVISVGALLRLAERSQRAANASDDPQDIRQSAQAKSADHSGDGDKMVEARAARVQELSDEQIREIFWQSHPHPVRDKWACTLAFARAILAHGASREPEPVAWLRDQRGDHEGWETLDALFVLGAACPRSLHGATYSPLYPPQASKEDAERLKAELAQCHEMRSPVAQREARPVGECRKKPVGDIWVSQDLIDERGESWVRRMVRETYRAAYRAQERRREYATQAEARPVCVSGRCQYAGGFDGVPPQCIGGCWLAVEGRKK